MQGILCGERSAVPAPATSPALSAGVSLVPLLVASRAALMLTPGLVVAVAGAALAVALATAVVAKYHRKLCPCCAPSTDGAPAAHCSPAWVAWTCGWRCCTGSDGRGKHRPLMAEPPHEEIAMTQIE